MTFDNVYEDRRRAESYAALEYPGTYYLAYRDLPAIIGRHVTGRKALDFGCGTGRSTRFLKNLGFETVGVDSAENMLILARERDPEGDYRLVDDSGRGWPEANTADLVTSIFTFDNIPGERKVALFARLKSLLRPNGRIINLVSSALLYTHDWASFTCSVFPHNFTAATGDTVRTMMLDVEDRRPVEDILWPDEAYRETYGRAGLQVVEVYRPLGKEDEPYPWVNETKLAPWTVWVLEAMDKQ